MKRKFVREVWVTVLSEVANSAPHSQVDPELLNEIKTFVLEINNKSDEDIYDYLVNISKNSSYQTSSFIKQIFAVDNYYERPENIND